MCEQDEKRDRILLNKLIIQIWNTKINMGWVSFTQHKCTFRVKRNVNSSKGIVSKINKGCLL